MDHFFLGHGYHGVRGEMVIHADHWDALALNTLCFKCCGNHRESWKILGKRFDHRVSYTQELDQHPNARGLPSIPRDPTKYCPRHSRGTANNLSTGITGAIFSLIPSSAR